MKKLLKTEDSEWGITQLFFAILFAFLFSVGMRYIWVDQFSAVESFKWLGELMINTNDGYYFAEGARDLLNGQTEYNSIDGSPVHNPVAQLTAFFASILPFSFETTILWMPSFLGSLLVIPLILIGQALKQPLMGFIAGVVGAVTWSYYNRTMTGYYDSDMLAIVLPTFVLWGIIVAIKKRENSFLLFAPLFEVVYLYWYPQGFSLSLALIGMTFIYTVMLERKEMYNYKLMSIFFIALFPIEAYIKIAVIIALFGVIFWLENIDHYTDHEENETDSDEVVNLKKKAKKRKITFDRYIIAVFLISGVALLFSGAFDSIIAQLKSYVGRAESAVGGTDEIQLKYYNVVQTVREASAIPFDVFVNRISGHPITFWISSLGVLLLIFRFRIMLIAIPMIGLGFLAYQNGLRFTVYAVPIYALGLGYLITIIVKDFNTNLLKYAFATILTTLALYPNYIHIKEYKVPVVFNKNEVAVLDELKQMAKSDDYTMAWWDYGYPIRYYADTRTFVDGAKHSGNRNYPASFSLMRDPIASANMARFSAEYFNNGKPEISHMMKDLGLTNPDEFIAGIHRSKFKLPAKTRDVYYYLPLRMLNILPTVGLFSQIDLKTGNQKIRPFFYQTDNFKDTGKEIVLGGGLSFDKTKGTLKVGNQEKPIDSFFITQYQKNGQMKTQRMQLRAGAGISIIFMQSYGKMIVVDNYTLNSAYFQLFILETYPRELFEPVILTPIAKVFRLKI
ncbi:putative membrane protein, required for N-linked glycosylation [Thiovulum sp. ES]|nr:putative membrane protein, required for N-linked glycosylation [Thiovulum sp. ES]